MKGKLTDIFTEKELQEMYKEAVEVSNHYLMINSVLNLCNINPITE